MNSPKAPSYGFRPLTHEDMPLLARWLVMPHVAAWWGDKEMEMKGIAETIDSVDTEPFIIELDGKPIGYIQSYDPHLDDGENPFQDQPTGTLGIDQFIGEPELVGKGHGTRLITEFVEMLFEEGAPRVILDPDPANKAAVRTYEKVGFRPVRRFRTENGGDALLMAIDNPEEADDE